MKKTNGSSLPDMRIRFESGLPRLTTLARSSPDAAAFRQGLHGYLQAKEVMNPAAVRQIERLIAYDGRTVHELSADEELSIETLTLLWRYLTDRPQAGAVSDDLWEDLFHQFRRLYRPDTPAPDRERVERWMKRWPSGLQQEVQAIRKENKERIVESLIRRIEHRHAPGSRYLFPEGCGTEQKRQLVLEWWREPRFHLTMAAKSPTELNRLLGHTLSATTLRLLHRAKAKGMPFFVTPYYLSLLDPTGRGYDDAAIRSYVLYSEELVEAYGTIRAWEREDEVVAGKPNAAGWFVPEGHNIHRRYPEVAILIPDSMGRACGGLCASCQRMYEFQSRRLGFDFEALRPRESWDRRLSKLMGYFEQDTQLRDILITGGDALMSQNRTLRNILDAVFHMAVRKRRANRKRPAGEKYAELQRVRLGTRLPVYLPMRVGDELEALLREFREKAGRVGVRQFVIQTHFQSPLEVTPEACEALRRLQAAGWTVTNQLVFTAASSRRGHTAQLRRVLNGLGVLCYYTFSVKGFAENYAVYTPNSRLMQEQCEEKVWGRLDAASEQAFLSLLRRGGDRAAAMRGFCAVRNLPFIASDRSVLNLPGIGKSMTFVTVGMTADGKRILEFDHDHTRCHSPMVQRLGKVCIRENKSLREYLRQMEAMGERIEAYESIWDYVEGETESRFPMYDYPDPGFTVTGRYSHLTPERVVESGTGEGTEALSFSE